jgi:hypothetical protein
MIDFDKLHTYKENNCLEVKKRLVACLIQYGPLI